MTVSGTPAGWYADPQVPGQVRYFDGTGWTEHTAPQPPPATTAVPVAEPLPPTAAPDVLPPAAAATLAAPPVALDAPPPTGPPEVPGGYPGAVGPPGYVPYGGAPGWGGEPYVVGPPVSTGWSSRTRLLVIGGAVLGGLVLLGVVLGLARLGESSKKAAGPDLVLSVTAPQTIVGRTPATTAEATQARTAMTPIITSSFKGLPNSTPPKLEIYGPGGASAPVRGNGYVVLVWTQVTKPFDQDSFAKGLLDGLTQAQSGASRQTFAEADGGKTVCSQSKPDGGDVSMVVCGWIRSGTGLIVTIEYDVPVDTVVTDTREVVASMTHVA